MLQTDILIIGGGPAGIVSAVTARKNNPAKKITLIRKNEKGVVPCGIPYIFKRLNSLEENSMPDKPLELNDVDLVIDEAVEIEPKEKKVLLKSNQEYSYEKLILASGSESVLIPIKGVEKQGVWQIKKDFEYLQELRKAILKSKNLVIIGGGFIGVELAEELSSIPDLNITIIEKGACLLGTTFDSEFAKLSEEKLKAKGVKIYTETTVKEIIGNEKAESVVLSNAEKVSVDNVILSLGSEPNVNLAQNTGIKIEQKGIWVDEYMRTNAEDIFAVGDCSITKDFFTRKNIAVMLASTACAEARIAGANLYTLKILRENKGTIAAFSTYLDGIVLGSAGLTETVARKEGFDLVVGESQCPNHHPGKLPDTENIKVKLVFARSSGILLGGQIAGPKSVSEMTNIIALAIQKEVTISEFETLQISTHPLLTAAPTVYPLITAAQSALGKM